MSIPWTLELLQRVATLDPVRCPFTKENVWLDISENALIEAQKRLERSQYLEEAAEMGELLGRIWWTVSAMRGVCLRRGYYDRKFGATRN